MKEKELENLLIVEGVNALGYGTVPKLVMKDRRLTPQAKAIYAYFCSYTGCGSTAFPKVSQIMYDLTMSNKTFYKHLELLTKYGYVSVLKVRQEGSKFDNNVYKLNTKPQQTVVEKFHHGENDEQLSTEKNQKKEKSVDKPVDNSHDGKTPPWRNSMTQNSTTKINSNKKINNNINIYSGWSKEELDYVNNWIYQICED